MQGMHADCPAVSWYVSAAHVEQLVRLLAAAWNEPTWQAVHHGPVVAVHTPVMNDPASHRVAHVAQADCEMLDWNMPTAHAAQPVWPVAFWYVPAPQAVQLSCAPAARWNVPARHGSHAGVAVVVHVALRCAPALHIETQSMHEGCPANG